jgi:putative transposase
LASPGSPGEKSYVESLKGKLRVELLNREILTTVAEARTLPEGWREDCNNHRPSSALPDRTPAEFRATLGCSEGSREPEKLPA